MAYRRWDQTLLPDGTSQQKWIEEHAGEYTVDEMAVVLSRTKHAIQQKLLKGGLRAKPPGPDVGHGCVEGIRIEKFLKAIKDKPRSRSELSKEFDRSENTIDEAIRTLRSLAYEIIGTETEEVIWSTRTTTAVEPPPTLWDESFGEFLIGSISDLHGGSKWAQFTNMRRCVEEMYVAGVRHILISGDLFAGNGVYRGQIHDLVTSSPTDQVMLIAEYLPEYDDLKYRALGGNHDYAIIKQGGFNPVRALASRRDDIEYVGFDLADVPITPEIDARLWHPMGGVPYAYSYRIQKMAEEVAFAELAKVIEKQKSPKVRFLLAGHLHIRVEFDAGPIFCAQVPCFEGQTPYLKRKGKTPAIGGLILEFQVTSDGVLRQDRVRFLRFAEIPNDYVHYPVPREEEIVLEPWFQLAGEGGEGE